VETRFTDDRPTLERGKLRGSTCGVKEEEDRKSSFEIVRDKPWALGKGEGRDKNKRPGTDDRKFQ